MDSGSWRCGRDRRSARYPLKITVIFRMFTPPAANGAERKSQIPKPKSQVCSDDRCAPRPAIAVTQLAYARRGIITPEMEFIAIRENGKVEQVCNLPNESKSQVPNFAPQMISITNMPAKRSARPSHAKSPRNLSATKSRAVAPSSPPTSIIPKPSR